MKSLRDCYYSNEQFVHTADTGTRMTSYYTQKMCLHADSEKTGDSCSKLKMFIAPFASCTNIWDNILQIFHRFLVSNSRTVYGYQTDKNIAAYPLQPPETVNKCNRHRQLCIVWAKRAASYLSFRRFLRSRVHERAAILQCPVNVSNHWAHITSRLRLLPWLQIFQSQHAAISLSNRPRSFAVSGPVSWNFFLLPTLFHNPSTTSGQFRCSWKTLLFRQVHDKDLIALSWLHECNKCT